MKIKFKRRKFSLWQIALVPFFIANCSPQHAQKLPPPSEQFAKYWLSGKAELNRYELTQARYGNLNRGEMVLIMVTEPFKSDTQVKSEITPGVGDELVLKAQSMRKFVTGIYDYTMTSTSFKPIAPMAKALKITSTSVEWCGQTFLQMNLAGAAYKVQSRSYFEAEADDDFRIANASSEDEIWQQIRIAPDQLPTGIVTLIPSHVSSRLRHKKIKAEVATASLVKSDAKHQQYRLVYAPGTPDERSVEYVFETEFPHRIVTYSEEYLDGFVKPRRLKTTAKLKKQILLEYWRTHDPEHEKLRRDFGITGL